jgi:parallel beta-helix repeat protein
MILRSASAALVAVVILVLTGAPAGASKSPIPVVGCDQAASSIVVTHSIALDPTCTYTGGLVITRSHVTLDCQGASIDGGEHDGVGILVTAPIAVSLTDITVRHCAVHGFENGMRVTRDGFRTLAAGHEYDHDYAQVRISDDQISDTGGVGIYVDGYVTGVTIDRADITGAGTTGVYLETGSKDNRVTNSTIVDNGYADTDPAGTPIQVGSVTLRYVSTGREGIAVDGSQDNLIRDNVIRGNSYGGVFLYQNCGENYTTDRADWLPRRTAASGNVIADNTISDEPNGVWIASRMSENLAAFDCSTPGFDTTGGADHVLDHATDNTVFHNLFEGDTHGVRIEDDDNHVLRNRFVGAVAVPADPLVSDVTPAPVAPPVEAVLVGTEFRTAALDHPVTGADIRDNSASLAGVAAPYTVIWGQTGGTFSGNRSALAPVALAPGMQPTINPLCMVLRVWLPSP